MYAQLTDTIGRIQSLKVNRERVEILRPLVDYMQAKVGTCEDINLNFICTHNSRRSHLCQVWAQIAAAYYRIPNVYCYSGGTEETALFAKIVETLSAAGINVYTVSHGNNPVYALKYDDNALPIIGFSKKYDAAFNPRSDFAAVMTCSQADEGCPFIPGASIRIPITYEDPKTSDNTALQDKVYQERSIQIASEMFYIFSQMVCFR